MKRTPSKPFFLRLLDDWVVDISAALALMSRWMEPVFGGWLALAAAANALGSFLLVATMFALIYKVMPRAYVQWKDVWVGALFTAFLFTLGKSLIGLYIGRSGVVSGFGAAGSLVVILLWVYYSAQIFFIGAEFTWIYANVFGSRRFTSDQPQIKLAVEGLKPER